jgi:hypothetical protein
MQNFHWYSAFQQAPVASSLLSRVVRAVVGVLLVFVALFVSALLVIAVIVRALFRSGRASNGGASASGGGRPGSTAGRRIWGPPSQGRADDVVDIEGREVR